MTRAYGVKGCSEPGCERKHYGRGLCNLHWSRARGPVRRAPLKAASHKKLLARRRRKLTGWTDEQYQTALVTQRGLCALCGKPFTGTRGGRPAADHNHKTGKARELLHSRCNLAVGQYEEFGEALRLYVERHDAKE